MAECIANILYNEFPINPVMNAEVASTVAKGIRAALENGACREFFEWYAQEHTETGSDSEMEKMVKWGMG